VTTACGESYPTRVSAHGGARFETTCLGDVATGLGFVRFFAGFFWSVSCSLLWFFVFLFLFLFFFFFLFSIY
jgi:hypothetical protein